MSSIGTGYDLSVSTYSPDGRLFQVEYANKAVEAAGVAIGLKCADGVILATERLLHSKLLVKGANRRIQSIDEHIGMATAGLLADGKHLGSRGREEAGNFRENYNAPITVQILADRLSGYTQAYTCYGSVRPFGISTLVAGVDKTGPRLFCIEPSGVYYGYRATAAGKGKALAKTELEKLLNKQTGEAGQGEEGMTVREGVMEVARISEGDLPVVLTDEPLADLSKFSESSMISSVIIGQKSTRGGILPDQKPHLLFQLHDDNKDKDFELEMTWVCAESNWKHAAVSQDLLVEAERKAREALEMGMEED